MDKICVCGKKLNFRNGWKATCKCGRKWGLGAKGKIWQFVSRPMFYVDCFTSLWSQHPVVINRETGRIVAKHFKGKFYEDAEKRAKILAEILNRRK